MHPAVHSLLIANMPRYRRILAAVLLLALAACSGGGESQAGRPSAWNPRLITEEEVAASTATDAFDLVQQLRPRWLVRNSALSIHADNDIMVYVNQQRLGGPQSLRQINPGLIREIRWLDANTATARFGLNHGHGAIQVITRAGG